MIAIFFNFKSPFQFCPELGEKVATTQKQKYKAKELCPREMSYTYQLSVMVKKVNSNCYG